MIKEILKKFKKMHDQADFKKKIYSIPCFFRCVCVCLYEHTLPGSVASAQLFQTFRGVIVANFLLPFQRERHWHKKVRLCHSPCFYLSLVGGVPGETVLINVNHLAS